MLSICCFAVLYGVGCGEEGGGDTPPEDVVDAMEVASQDTADPPMDTVTQPDDSTPSDTPTVDTMLAPDTRGPGPSDLGPAEIDTTGSDECSPAVPCQPAEVCVAGACFDECSLEAAAETGYGCQYFAVDLENIGSSPLGVAPQDVSFAVTLINPSPTRAVRVTVHEYVDGPIIGDYEFDLQPTGRQVVPLGSRNVAGTLKDKLAYVLEGDGPFSVLQANPLNTFVSTNSNDISRLLPATPEADEFLVMTGRYNAFVTIVGTEDGTKVSIRPAGDIQAGGGIKFMKAGTLYTVTLHAGDVLNLRSAGTEIDLSGTEVFSTAPVTVFGGNVLSRTANACCADHLEQQIPPLGTWGLKVVAGRSAPRGSAPDYWRVMASTNDTEITFSPSVHPPVTLQRGQWVEFASASSFQVEASSPILVGQLLASAHEASLQGAYCFNQVDCPNGQQCVIEPGAAVGRCFAECAVVKDDCPSPVFTCHDRSGDLPGMQPGDGYCHRNTCEFDDGPCAVGTTCVVGFQNNVCYEPCNVQEPCAEPGAVCGLLESQTVCSPQTCTEEEPLCPSMPDVSGGPPIQSECMVVGESKEQSGHCQWSCKASQTCSVPGYRCLSSKLYPTGQKPFVGDVCVPPICFIDADCPSGHLCGSPNEDTGISYCKPIGDPALLILTPVEQYERRVVISVPDGYAFNYVTVSAPKTAAVQLDGKPVQPLDFEFAGPGYKTITLPVSSGLHRLTSSEPIGVTIHGFADEVSYGSVAGGRLVPNNTSGTGPVGPEQDVEVVDTNDTDDVGPSDTTDVAEPDPTWNNDILPILQLRCAACHLNGADSGDANFDNYEAVLNDSLECEGVTMGEAIVLKVVEPNPCVGTIMPPVGDPVLASELLILQKWLAAGMPEE